MRSTGIEACAVGGSLVPVLGPGPLAPARPSLMTKPAERSMRDITAGEALLRAEADGEGFEPPLDLRPEQFSRLPP